MTLLRVTLNAFLLVCVSGGTTRECSGEMVCVGVPKKRANEKSREDEEACQIIKSPLSVAVSNSKVTVKINN